MPDIASPSGPAGSRPHHRHTVADASLASPLGALHPSVEPFGHDGALEALPILGPLLDAVPEFTPAYRAMAAACGDQPGEPSVLMELADFVAEHLTTTRRERTLVARILAVVEAHLGTIASDDEGCELVAFAFFDALDPELRYGLAPLAGPMSRALIEELDAPIGPDSV